MMVFWWLRYRDNPRPRLRRRLSANVLCGRQIEPNGTFREARFTRPGFDSVAGQTMEPEIMAGFKKEGRAG